MKVLLLANQPEKTTRLKLFGKTLMELGYDVIIPSFGTRNWITISINNRKIIEKNRPDIVHIFNVPDVIYHGLPKLKGSLFSHLIYDYRSPWGIETGITFGPLARNICERFEYELAKGADIITTPNRPLGQKVLSYPGISDKPSFIVPNYPSKNLIRCADNSFAGDDEEEGAIIFVGRISRQEGIKNLLNLARKMPEERFWVVGDGPFARYYLSRKPNNVKFFGWQSQERVACLVGKSKICLIIPDQTEITQYATERSIWKLNEYLSLGKIVIASGISVEDKRKNLILVNADEMEMTIREYMTKSPEKLTDQDFKFWELNNSVIKQVYDRLE